MKQLRIGILSTAQIAKKNWKAIFNTGNATVSAVASRDLARSRQFITDCQRDVPFPVTPAAFGSYEELLASPAVDAVYIPLPTGLRKEWVIRAAQAGKHIVCEKPCAANLPDLEDMLAACRQHRVQFLDGVMFMHSQRLARIRETLDDGHSIGPIKRITSQLTFCAPDEFLRGNIRMQAALEPQGCVGDLGWYCLRFSLWAMKWQMPRRVRGRMLAYAGGDSGTGTVPTEFSGELFFEGGVSAGFYCSFITDGQGWANIGGTKGYLRLDDFVLPFSGHELHYDVFHSEFEVRGCDFEMKPGVRRIFVPEGSHSVPDAQETNLFRNFAAQVLSGKLNEDWPKWSLQTQRVMEACLESARTGHDMPL